MEIKKRVVSLTMFDFLKGFGILLVLFKHSLHISEMQLEQNVLCRLTYSVLMPLFFVTSGYWLKKRTFEEGVAASLKSLIKPYLIVIVSIDAVGFVHRLIHNSLDEWLFLFLRQSLFVYSGSYSRIGAMWFVFALMISWIIFYGMIQIKNEKARGLLSIVVCWIGTLLLPYMPPFQLAQGMIGQLFVYFGYLMKKRKLLEKKISAVALTGLTAIWLVGSFYTSRYSICDLATYRFGNGMPSVFFSICGTFLLIFVGIRLNSLENVIVEKIGLLGRYTMWILCIHSFESAVVPWKYLFWYIPEDTIAGSMTQLAVRSIFIFLGCTILQKITRMRRN